MDDDDAELTALLEAQAAFLAEGKAPSAGVRRVARPAAPQQPGAAASHAAAHNGASAGSGALRAPPAGGRVVSLTGPAGAATAAAAAPPLQHASPVLGGVVERSSPTGAPAPPSASGPFPLTAKGFPAPRRRGAGPPLGARPQAQQARRCVRLNVCSILKLFLPPALVPAPRRARLRGGRGERPSGVDERC